MRPEDLKIPGDLLRVGTGVIPRDGDHGIVLSVLVDQRYELWVHAVGGSTYGTIEELGLALDWDNETTRWHTALWCMSRSGFGYGELLGVLHGDPMDPEALAVLQALYARLARGL